ncbi:hypothetical protein ACIOEX_23620 [Streptomyces sp. NPDC087850]
MARNALPGGAVGRWHAVAFPFLPFLSFLSFLRSCAFFPSRSICSY